jgi:hypothetical protein
VTRRWRPEPAGRIVDAALIRDRRAGREWEAAGRRRQQDLNMPPLVMISYNSAQRAARRCDAFVPVLSPSFLESSHCRLEVLTARSFGRRILPVMVEDCLRTLGHHPETEGLNDIFMMFFNDLRSVGVPISEEEAFQRVVHGITLDPASPAPAANRPVYVAHVWSEAAFADRLAQALDDRGQSTWIAARHIPVGVRWFDEQIRAIHRARAMVVVINEHAPAARHLRTEIALAGVLGLPVLPVLSDVMKGDWEKRKALNAAFQRTDDLRVLYETEPFTSDPDWRSMIDEIDAALSKLPADPS